MKPILFNTPMTQAIQEGRKTVTRRVVKGAKPHWTLDHLGDHEAMTKVRANGEEYPADVPGLWATFEWDGLPEFPMVKAPYQPGDILWVRETWARLDAEDCGSMCIGPCGSYKGQFGCFVHKALNSSFTATWHPSIHMPQEAARLFLRVTGTRVERLQDIGEESAMAEGVKDPYDYQAPAWYDQHGLTGNYTIDAFAGLWNSTIKPADLPLYGWESNPWVWVIRFERISKEAALLGGGGDVR